METKSEFYSLLREKGQRITAPKKIILDIFLSNRDKMLSVNDVYGALPNSGAIDHATVYRNIQKFLSFGLLESMIDDRGISRYTLCDKGQHHYLICTECGRIIKFPCTDHYWCGFAQENGFLETNHRLEVYGKCAECRKHAP